MADLDVLTNYGTFPPDWSVGVLYAGRQACAPEHSWEGVRDHFVIHLVVAGSGRVRWKRREDRLSEGGLFVIRPGERVFYQADPQRPWNYKWIGFGGVHAESLVRTLCEDNTFPAFRITKPREASRLIELVIASLEKGKRAAATKAAGLALQFLALLQEQREQPVERRTSAAQLVGEARAFVDQNYQREIDVAAVVNHIGVDRAHFSRVFRQQVGHSLQEYLIATRMERAGRLLVETSLPVHAVASSVGYRNYASFARRFAEYFGCSPSDRRRSAQAVP